MSERHPNRENPTADGLGGFDGDAKRDAAKTLVEGSIPSSYAAERFSTDEVFEILAHPGQRYVLTYLLQSSGDVPLNSLVEYAVLRSDTASDRKMRDRMVIELTHTVLPKLADYGFIEYDMEHQIIRTTGQTPTVEPFLRLALVQEKRAEQVRERTD
jgi:hypothetical protein